MKKAIIPIVLIPFAVAGYWYCTALFSWAYDISTYPITAFTVTESFTAKISFAGLFSCAALPVIAHVYIKKTDVFSNWISQITILLAGVLFLSFTRLLYVSYIVRSAENDFAKMVFSISTLDLPTWGLYGLLCGLLFLSIVHVKKRFDSDVG